MTSTTPTAGSVLAAAAALQDPTRDTYTRDQVAYLMHLAYLSGGTARHVGDIHEMTATWARHPHERATAEQRHAERMAEMTAAATRINAELGRPADYEYRGGPVDWATGRPARRLEVAA